MQMGMPFIAGLYAVFAALTTRAQNDQCDHFGCFPLVYFDFAHCRVVCPRALLIVMVQAARCSTQR